MVVWLRYLVVLLGLVPTALRADDGVMVDTAIVLAVDVSGSMDPEELAVQRAGYLEALRHPDLMRIVQAGPIGRIAISHFEWAGQPRRSETVAWRVIENPDDISAFAAEIEAISLRTSFGTSISGAIDHALEVIAAAEFGADRWVIDVSGDGPNNMGDPVDEARDRALDLGVTINGLPIILRPSRGMADLAAYYEACVTGGPGSFVMAARSREELAPAIQRKLFRELYGAAPERIYRAQAQTEGPPDIDCLIGEKLRLQRGRVPIVTPP